MEELHPSERPRERLERRGPEAVSDEELLALVLGTGVAGASSLELAARVRAACPDGLAGASFAGLRRVRGIGPARAARLSAALELGRRCFSRDARPLLDSPARVADQVPASVRGARKEHFLAFYVNARSQLVHSETVSIGTLSASLVHPREVFSPALASAAAGVIVAHNHPSGDCSPSPEDKDATRRLQRSGELLGIPLLDHLIVSERGFFSFKENGVL